MSWTRSCKSIPRASQRSRRHDHLRRQHHPGPCGPARCVRTGARRRDHRHRSGPAAAASGRRRSAGGACVQGGHSLAQALRRERGTLLPDLDFSVSQITTVRLEENVAEKIARLNRTTTARDVYDLVWLWRHYRDDGGLDTDLVRRLAVLKIWVDKHGVRAKGAHWKPGHDSSAFDPEAWLRLRPAAEFDQEDIGQLSVPAPDLDELAGALVDGYAFLRDLDPDERTVACISAADRGLVLRMLADLPGGRLAGSTY
ncbi:nucleotidyl transferase AbiEii/AbiGii toxin family protein [Promicromonospora sp. NPDC023987]|uniref:nucleotidyl transferase AbiEii/AbiGii toxin family protein n=1 Tax=Promicromonospora sp. NPDC023987 TaxID=3155360 RepID=UPI0033F0010F